jgi:hypothetical protein
VNHTQIHLCLNVDGAIREARDKVRRRAKGDSYANFDNGIPMSWAQFEKALMIEKNKGHDVIPMDRGCANPCTRAHLGCTGFVYSDKGETSGCPGHRPDGAAA